jgi:hypothetical protein
MEKLEISRPVAVFSKVYFIEKYVGLCEPHFKIQKIIYLKRHTGKKVLNIF